MKKKTMERLMALPKDSQDKVWKLAMERLKKEQMQKMQKNDALRTQDKQTKK